MLLCSIKFQWFCRQNFLRILFTLETFPSLSSALAINSDIAKLVSGASPSIWRAKLTMPSAVSLGSWVFRSFVPIWRTTLSGFFLRRGLTKSSISSVVAPGKDVTTTLFSASRNAPATNMLDDRVTCNNGYWFSCMLVRVSRDWLWKIFLLMSISFFRHDLKSGSERISFLRDIFNHVVLLSELVFQHANFIL